MGLVLGTIITMGLQIGASIINQKLNKETLDEIKQFQQGSKRARQERGNKRDFEKFKRSCEFQIQMEQESHTERINNLNVDFINTFKKMTHNETLKSHYPLKVSPYVIGKSVIPLYTTQIGTARTELFCILTNSNIQAFNNTVLPFIDSTLCNTFASLWNEKSMHTICYYSDIWKEESIFADEDIDNLKSVLKSPTLTITPYFEKEGSEYNMILKLNFWGIGNELSAFVPTGVKMNFEGKISKEDRVSIISNILPITLCSVGQIVDVFYWSNYHLAPLLPTLLSQSRIPVEKSLLTDISTAYQTLFKQLALGIVESEKDSLSTNGNLADIVTINQYNFPDRSVNFLSSLVELAQQTNGNALNALIKDTCIQIYEVRTGNRCESLSLIDVSILDYDEMKLVTDLINIANKSGNIPVAKELTSLVSRKILL